MKIFFTDLKTYDSLFPLSAFRPKNAKPNQNSMGENAITVLSFRDFEKKKSVSCELNLAEEKICEKIHLIKKCENVFVLAHSLSHAQFAEKMNWLWNILVYSETNLQNVIFVTKELFLGDFALMFVNTMYVAPLVTDEKYFSAVFKEQKKLIFKGTSYLYYKFHKTLLYKIARKFYAFALSLKKKFAGGGYTLTKALSQKIPIPASGFKKNQVEKKLPRSNRQHKKCRRSFFEKNFSLTNFNHKKFFLQKKLLFQKSELFLHGIFYFKKRFKFLGALHEK